MISVAEAVYTDMTFTTAHMSMSLDGFVAGPDQTLEEPIGHGGMTLHSWHLDAEQAGHEVDRRWASRLPRPRGAYVMGRNMFGPVRGPWSSYDGDWHGWWGDEPHERAKEAGRPKGQPRNAPPKLVEGAIVQGWNAAFGALSLAFPGRLEPKL